MDLLTAVGEKGGSVSLVTLTMRHHKGQGLAYLWDALSAAWNAVNRGMPMQRDKDRFGIVGRIRVVEVMHSPENGWHVHLHVLVCFDGPMSPELATELGRRWFARWSRHLVRRGLDAPIEDRGGLDVRPVDLGDHESVRTVGEYLAKITHEVTGGQAKTGRQGSRSPFGILRDCLETGLADDCELWLEWEQASFRRRMITYHDGLREWAGVRDEQTDQEIVEENRGGGAVLAISDADDVRRAVAHLPTILDMGEKYGAAAVRIWLGARGIQSFVPRDHGRPSGDPPPRRRQRAPRVPTGDMPRHRRDTAHRRGA